MDASVPIRLDRDHDWDEPVVEGAAVEVTRTAFESDPGYDEYQVRALEPGRATVTLRAPDTTATFQFVIE